MRKLKDPASRKDLLEIVCEWPVKRENCECFLPHKFPIIQYSIGIEKINIDKTVAGATLAA